VVAQHEEAPVAQIAHQARLLLVVERDALVVVIGQRREHEDRLLRDRQHAAPLGRHGDAVQGVQVDDAAGVLARGVDRAVDGEAGRVDLVRAVHHLGAAEIHLDQAGGGDLVEQHPVRVDEEVVLRPGHPRRDVGEDQVVPPVVGDQPVAGGQIHSLAPLLFTDLSAY
jgi:hypothetical protein